MRFPTETAADKIVLVNIVILAICLPLLILCLLQQLWFPTVVFSFLAFSNGYQLWTVKGPRNRSDNG